MEKKKKNNKFTDTTTFDTHEKLWDVGTERLRRNCKKKKLKHTLDRWVVETQWFWRTPLKEDGRVRLQRPIWNSNIQTSLSSTFAPLTVTVFIFGVNFAI